MHLCTYWRIEAKLPDDTLWTPLTDLDGIDNEARARELLAQAHAGDAEQEFRLVRIEEYLESEG